MSPSADVACFMLSWLTQSRLHNVTVLSAAHDSGLESDERLAMLFEGTFRCLAPGGISGGGNEGVILLSFFTLVRPTLSAPDYYANCEVLYAASSATLRLADNSSAPILGRSHFD